MRTSKPVSVRALFLVVFCALSYPVMAQLKADFNSTPQSGCGPLIVSFTNTSKGNPGSWKWDLGNGVISTEENPATSYFDPGTYNVRLVVYKGQDSTVKTAVITVYENPVADFKLSDSIGCFPLHITYNDKSNPGSGTIAKHTWDFGDGTISNEAQPSHNYLAEGAFSVTLSVTNSFGCSATYARQDVVRVSKGVHADFSFNADAICHSPAVYNFNSTSTGSGTLTYKWAFGDGGAAKGEKLSHGYKTAGNYPVALNVTSDAGCSDTITKQVSVAFVKSAITSNDTVCIGGSTKFTNAAVPAPASSIWSFGDSTTSTDINPSKIYKNAGTYQVKVVNTFFAGCVDSATKKIKVVAAAIPSFKIADTAGCSLPFTAAFKNTTQGNATYVWDFGDGTTSTDAEPTHVYNKYGNYTVTLKATNGGGCVNTVSKTSAVVLQQFKIAAVTGDRAGCIPFTVKPVVKTNIAEPVTTYSWDFGDGFVSSLPSPSHTYTSEGLFTVKVKVMTAGGCVDSLSFVDSVGHKLKPSFTAAPTDVCASTQVNFVNTTKEASSNLWWNLGDGTIVYKLPNPGHNYIDTGYFDVTLIVEKMGCYDTVTQKKGVHIKGPIAKFEAQRQCISRTQVGFINKSIDDRTRKWDFGDGLTDTAKNPVHTYAAPGLYVTKLVVSNGTCTYETKANVFVVNEKGKFNITDTVVCRNTALNYSVSNVNTKNIASTVWQFVPPATTYVQGNVSITYKYPTAGKYTPVVVVTDVLGCADTLTANNSVRVYGPTAKFVALEKGACKDSTIHFKDASSTDGTHPLTSWAFDYGNGNKNAYNTNGPFQNTYNEKGTYSVSLIVKDTYGCADTNKQNNIVLITKPVAKFTIGDTTICPGRGVAFHNLSDGVGLSFAWNLGDGRQSTGREPSGIAYTKLGTYDVKLVVSDINGCKDSVTTIEAVRVYMPTAKFLLSDSVSSCPPLTVNFTNQSSNFASIQWNFGDGNTSTIAAAAHIYTYPGVYTAKVVATGLGGCADSATKKITIKGPTGTLQYSKAGVCYPYAQQFKAVSQNAVQYIWDYSDGNTKQTTRDTSSHIYAPGAYLPKLILVDDNGCKVPIKGPDTLKVYTITAKIGGGSHVLCDSGNVTFIDSSITNDVVKTHKWIFDDNTTASGATTTHRYTASGTYSVTLVDVTANGCTDTVKLNTPVKVVKSLSLTIDGTTSYCAPASVALLAQSNVTDSSGITWNWDFGNGTTVATQNVTGVAFNNAGNYPVKVVAQNSSGCKGTAQVTIAVHAAPALKAIADTMICKNTSISLKATGADTYAWQSSSNLSCNNCNAPIAQPDSTAKYLVTGKNAFGCTASDSVTVKVSQPVHVSIAKNDTLCNGEAKQLMASGAHSYQWSPAIYLDNEAAAQPTFKAVKDTTVTYKVIGRDEKKCFTDSAYVKVKVYPIPQMQVLQTAATVSAGGQVTLTTQNSPDVTKWKWTPPVWLSNPNAASPVAQPRESITYTVVAANDGACVTRAQIAVTVICNGGNIFVPNTFSPNGDGVNETFYPQGRGIYNIKSFRVFNRWGQLVFEKLNGGANNPADGWDGTFKGQKLASDVFIYIIEVLCNNNTIIPVKGNVTLIR